MDKPNIPQMRDRIADFARRVVLAQGELNGIATRKDELTMAVGLAKGRLDNKKDVEKFIEELQADTHAKRVGDFERLLSALVMEILPGEKPVSLELEIERGQPSLDIVSRVSADLCEDIFEDQGGALTNIIVLGLRMIAVVRSGMRRFLVLDEPDCWVKTDRIHSFYAVVKEAARKIGVQCFAISHHDIAHFSDGISVAKLHGHPENKDGVWIENNPRPHRWSDDEEGYRSLRLQNFQGYIDQTLHLAPGVNTLIGDNNTGKSSLVRAYRAVLYGDARDSLVRRGEAMCAVEIALKRGRTLRWERSPKRNPVNLWKLLNPDGTVVQEDGMVYETGGRAVPAWVGKIAGIAPILGLDPHIIKQKTPVFLLDKPGTTRAAVLAIGQESSHIREMIRVYKKMCEKDSATVKDGEIEMSGLLDRESRLDKIVALEDRIKEMSSIVAEIEARSSESAKLEALASKIDTATAGAGKAKRRIEILSRLPGDGDIANLERDTRTNKTLDDTLSRIERATAERQRNARVVTILSKLPDTVPELVSSDALIKVGKVIKDTRIERERHRKVIDILSRVPEEIPVLIDSARHVGVIDRIERSTRELANAAARKNKAGTDVEACQKQLEELVESMGGACPLCGTHVDDAGAFFDRHDHANGGHTHA
jgi:hypothetical protein